MSDEVTQSNAPAEPSGQQAPEAAPKGAAPQPKPGETPAQAARRHRLAVNGTEEEVDDREYIDRLLEIHGPEGLRNIGQIGSATRRKMGEVTNKEKRLLEAAEDLQDPSGRRAFALLERLHGRAKARQMVEDWYGGLLEEESLPPEEREHRKLKGEVERLRKEREQLEKEKREREEARVTQQQQRTIGKTFAAALAEVGEEPTPHALARMAALAEAEFDESGSFDPRELAREVAQDYEAGEVAARIRKLASNPEKLAKMLGDDGLRAFRKWDVERVKGSQRQQVQQQPAQQPQSRREERQRVPVDDFFASLQRKER